MNKRWIALAVFLIVLVVAILLALFVRPGAKTPTPAPSVATAPSAPAAPPAVPAVPPVPPTATSVQMVSKLFAERYGSYSTEADFANLTDTLPLMTDAFAAKTRAVIQSSKIPTAFYGVTTRAVTLSVSALDASAGTARVAVSTQRVETVGNAAPVTKYQTLNLTLLKVGADWKVDSATWK